MQSLKFVLVIWVAIVFIFIAQPTTTRSAPSAPPTLAGCPMYPADNIWNVPVDTLPVDANSSNYVSAMGSATNAHADFGTEWDGFPIGIPYTTVLSTQPKVFLTFDNTWNENNLGPYPIPNSVPIEGDPAGDGDRHILILDKDNCRLYEIWAAHKVGSVWHAGSAAIFTVTQNAPLRPDGWTSADAAGLPILPGLVKYDETISGEINHAIRFTSSNTKDAYVWPARHSAEHNALVNSPPMGQRFRLKASFAIDSRFSPEMKTILRALKKYGAILADNGTSWYFSGVPDPRWSDDDLHAFDTYLKGSDFEAVNVSSLIVNTDSWQALQGFAVNVNPSAHSIEPGDSTAYYFSFTPAGGFNGSITLTASSPSPSVTLQLSALVVTPSINVTVTLTDTHLSGVWYYSFPITATSPGLNRTASISLLIGGLKVYLPISLKNY